MTLAAAGQLCSGWSATYVCFLDDARSFRLVVEEPVAKGRVA